MQKDLLNAIFNQEQTILLNDLGIPPLEITEEYIANCWERVSDCLQEKGFDEDYKPTRIGLLCESILDRIEEF